MTKVSTLFDDSNDENQFFKQTENEKKFQTKLETQIPVIVKCMKNAFFGMETDLDSRPLHYRNHLTKSNRMNEQIKGNLTDIYGDKIIKLPYNRFGLSIEGYVLLFKKLDKFNRPSNVKTDNNTNIAVQGKLNFPGQPEVVYIGYRTDASYSQLISVNAVKIENKEIVWSSNLTSITNSSIVSIASQTVVTTDDIQVKVTKSKNKKTG